MNIIDQHAERLKQIVKDLDKAHDDVGLVQCALRGKNKINGAEESEHCLLMRANKDGQKSYTCGRRPDWFQGLWRALIRRMSVRIVKLGQSNS